MFLSPVPSVFRRRRIGSGGGAPGVLPGNVATASFTALGATQPWYAGSTQYNAAHYNGRTYVVWETYDRVPDKRYCNIRAYTHATGEWGEVWTVGPECETENDDHSVPAICFNADARAVVIYGHHDGNFKLAIMTNPEDETLWTVLNDGFVGEYTYPHPVLIGTAMYVMFREDIPAGVEFASGSKVLVYRPVTFAGATATVGAAVRIGDLANNARWYQGNHILLGNGRVAQCCARADYNDTFRRNGYYYEIDFAGGQLVNIAGVASPFPVVGATMASNFMVHDSTTGTPRDMGAPSLAVDSTGRKHIVFTKGTGTASPEIYHMVATTTSFSAPVSIATVTNGSDLADLPRLINGKNNSLEVYYNRDPDALWGRGGNVYRKVMTADTGDATSWGSEELVMAADNSRFALGQIGNVHPAHANARIVFGEVAQDPLNTSAFPGKRLFVLGDGGFLPHAQPSGTAPTPTYAWYDPSDHTSLWADAGRTTPASVDGPVAVIDDKSGNGFHLALEGLEPGTLRQDDGVSWIDIGDEFSPTTSYTNVNLAPSSGGAYWITAAFRDHEDTGANTTVPLALDSGSGNPRYTQLVKNASNGGVAGTLLRVTQFATTASVDHGASAPLLGRNNNDIIWGLHVNGTAGIAYINGNQWSTGTAGSNPPTGAARLRIGANSGLSSSSYLQGRFYGAIIRSGNVDLATRQQDMTYLRSRMPR